MARPKKTDTDKRSIILPVRVSAAEKIRMETIAADAGLSVSDLIRSRILGAKVSVHKPKPERKILIRLLSEQNKVGSNLNQIARVLNTNEKLKAQAIIDRQLLEDSLNAIVTLTRFIRETLQHGHKG